MKNQEEKRFTKKHGAVLMLSLCLVGAAAFTTFYTLNSAERTKEQEQTTELQEENRIRDANAAKHVTPKVETEKETEKGKEVSVKNAVDEIEEDPSKLTDQVKREAAGQMEEKESEAANASTANVQAEAAAALEKMAEPALHFSEDAQVDWPVAGTVLLDYSMDASVFFPTLKVYKYNPALVIGAEVGSQVVSSARGVVKSIEIDEETGTTLTVDVGDQYEMIYGQLKEVPVSKGELIEEGELLGYVSEPTKYYCEEGSNLYFQMKKDGEPIDPFLYLGE